MDDAEAEEVRSLGELERSLVWAKWVSDPGPEAASRRWLSIFAQLMYLAPGDG